MSLIRIRAGGLRGIFKSISKAADIGNILTTIAAPNAEAQLTAPANHLRDKKFIQLGVLDASKCH
jgi:hypothetical protein